METVSMDYFITILTTTLMTISAMFSAVAAVGVGVLAYREHLAANAQREWEHKRHKWELNQIKRDLLIILAGGHSPHGLRFIFNQLFDLFRDSDSVCDSLFKLYRVLLKGDVTDPQNVVNALSLIVQEDMGIFGVIGDAKKRAEKRRREIK